MANAGSFGMPKRDHRLWARSFYGLQKDTVQSPRVVSNRLVNHSSSKHYDRCVCAKQSVGLKWFLSDLLHKSAPNKVLKLPKHPKNLPRTPTAAPTPPTGPPAASGAPVQGPFFEGRKTDPGRTPKDPPRTPPDPSRTPKDSQSKPRLPPDEPGGGLGSSRPGPIFRGSKNGPWTDPKRPPESTPRHPEDSPKNPRGPPDDPPEPCTCPLGSQGRGDATSF